MLFIDATDGGDIMCKRTHVPDKLEGYMLQVRHALYDLITTEDVIVSVEGYDDVATETDKTVVAEQTKSVLSNNNPVTNKAVSFWKTVHNWSQYIKNSEFPLKQLILRYVIISAHKLSVGSIPQSFFDAKDEIQAKQALETARQELFVSDQGTLDLSKECQPYVSYCFSSENEESVIKAIIAMELDLHEDSYDNDLKAKFCRQPIPLEYKEELFISMLGWVQDKIHQYTKKSKSAYIKSSEYRDALIKEIRGRNTNDILSAVSTIPNDEQTGEEVLRRDVYIRQLELIEMDSTELFCAASDYLRTKAEVIAWAERGIVTELSFSDYREGLKRIWKNEKMAVQLKFSEDIKQGKLLYLNCSREVGNKTLQGKAVPSFFGSGFLQSLANEPKKQPEIGWHPNYANLLKENNDE